jgi:shikimate kinase
MGIPAIIRNIILLGPKHAGKTTIGRELAKLLGSSFIDLDELIEVRTGKSPRALYKESPETFRAAEIEALESLLFCPLAGDNTAGRDDAPVRGRGIPAVIAAGGGIIDNSRARDLLFTAGGLLLVSLEVSAETAWERVSAAAEQSGELPPFLNTENPRETHRLLHERRTAAYREIARIRVSEEGRTFDETVQEIIKAVVIQLQGTR